MLSIGGKYKSCRLLYKRTKSQFKNKIKMRNKFYIKRRRMKLKAKRS